MALKERKKKVFDYFVCFPSSPSSPPTLLPQSVCGREGGGEEWKVEQRKEIYHPAASESFGFARCSAAAVAVAL